MKKPFDYKVVDKSRLCVVCHQPLKCNLIAKSPKAIHCYTCSKLLSNNLNLNREELKRRQNKRLCATMS